MEISARLNTKIHSRNHIIFHLIESSRNKIIHAVPHMINQPRSRCCCWLTESNPRNELDFWLCLCFYIGKSDCKWKKNHPEVHYGIDLVGQAYPVAEWLPLIGSFDVYITWWCRRRQRWSLCLSRPGTPLGESWLISNGIAKWGGLLRGKSKRRGLSHRLYSAVQPW